jgi:hypothetical protein
MTRIFLFSPKNAKAMKILEGLAESNLVICSHVISASTVNPHVADLLAELDGSDEMGFGEEQILAPILVVPQVETTRKPRKVRKAQTGALIECPKCHEKKFSAHMTKAGICKVCHMRELKAAKSQLAKKSQNTYGHGKPPKPEFGRIEHSVNTQSKPKDHIDLAKLAGRIIA